MARIKVLYVIDYLSAGGGTERQLRELIVNLDRDRVEPILVTLSKLDWHGLPEHVNPNCEHFCLEIPSLASPKGISQIFALAKYIRREKIDLVHTFFLDANIVGVLAALLGGRKTVIVSRRDVGYWYTPRRLFVYRQFNRLADYFLVNSSAIKRAVAEHERFRPERIKVIRNGFFSLPDDTPSPLTRASFGIPDDVPLVGIVANLRPVKRIDRFVEAAAACKSKNAHFMVIGIGELKEALQQQAERAGLNGRFHMTHTLDSIYDYVKLFDIGVLTSESEGLSNTLIEYQLCGKPALAFDVGGNNEVIVNEKTGYLIPPDDLDILIAKLDLLLADSQTRQTMGKAAAAWAREEFKGARLVEQTTTFYEQALTGTDVDETGCL